MRPGLAIWSKSEVESGRFDVRSALISGHHAPAMRCPKSANSGSRGRGLLDQIAGAARRDGASLWKSCFAEAVDKHLSVPSTATGYPFRNAKIGFEFEQTGPPPPSLLLLVLDEPGLPRGSDRPSHKVWFWRRAFLAAATASSKRPRPMNATLIPANVEKSNGSNGLSRMARSKLRIASSGCPAIR